MLCICGYLHCLPKNSKTLSKERTHYNNKGLRFNLTIILQKMPKTIYWYNKKKEKENGDAAKINLFGLQSKSKSKMSSFKVSFLHIFLSSVMFSYNWREKKKVNCTNHTTWAHLSLQLHDQWLESCLIMLVKFIFKVSEMKNRNCVV